MKMVFVDTSGFYACLDGTDPFHPQAFSAFERAEKERWQLVTTNYIVHETWALVQRRLGWEAVETFLNDLLPRCRVEWVDENLHQAAALRCRQMRERRYSLTDAVSLEYMSRYKINEAIVQDEHFARTNIVLP
jgi:predicted nucleic acid-binding protein